MAEPSPLDPQVADLLSRIKRANRPPYWQQPAKDVRAFYEKASQVLEIAPAVVADTRELWIPVGGASIAARLHTGMDVPDTGAPLLIFSHGGGFTIGSINTHDAVCRMLANGARCKVLSLDYRLAPEYPFPTAAEDVFAAYRWAFAQYEMLGVDPQRIAGMGDSAGGTLTAQAALRCRDAGLSLCAEVFLYPGMGSRQDSESYRTYREDYLLDGKTVQWFFGNYLRSEEDRQDWRFAPMNAPELAGLPPTFVQVAECDPVRDDGLAYARRLEQSGVAVQTKVYRGAIHGFYNFGGALRIAREAHRDSVDYLRAAFGTSNVT
jgi:acetyl esterase